MDKVWGYGARSVFYAIVGRLLTENLTGKFKLLCFQCTVFHVLCTFVNEYNPKIDECGWLVIEWYGLEFYL
eukprot:TRINITY_DN9630_c0_g1_i1.p2 TRINITY_DN9630_c0_g1~~TRINITY_DN9630_c0_g1_i1.p2  ORF type:complete len:71 (-),score=4.70 TRINITY_DN9630_c0_g1_i1:329-541(-)